MTEKHGCDQTIRLERITVPAGSDWIARVDDWSFANRIRSRSEAIRRLVDQGLAKNATKEGA